MKEMILTSYDVKKYTNAEIKEMARKKGFDPDKPIHMKTNRITGVSVLTQEDNV